jgi:adenylate cyclase class 2
MPPANQETEAKFYVARLADIDRRLQMMSAPQIQPRTKELNLRFDLPRRQLQRLGRVLRLRRDNSVRLTYKDAAHLLEGTSSRHEIEFAVSDFDSAQKLLEALGYQVVFVYEKYRTTYQRSDAQIMLDELPYGDFIEIEGEVDQIHAIVRELALNGDAAIPLSYHALFQRLARARGLKFRDLTFNNFADIQVHPADLGVRPADENSLS